MSNHRTESGRDSAAQQEQRKPDKPTDLKGQSWKYGLRRALKEFSDDQCTDLAAALTYYAVLSLFPAVIAMVSLVGLVGQGPQATDALLKIVARHRPPAVVTRRRADRCSQLSRSTGAGFALVLGLATALWSASGYVGAFGRAMNRIYEIGEGRPFWKLRPLHARSSPSSRSSSWPLVALVAGRHRPGRPGGRQRHRPRQHGGHRLEHRQVAGDARSSSC